MFNASKGGQIIGGVVTDGTICEGGQFKLIREDTEVSRGTITGLEQNRIKAREITTDTQFGAMIDCKQTVQEGDYLDAFDTIIA